MATNPFDQFDAAPAAANPFDQFDAQAPQKTKGFGGDVVTAFKQGVQQLPGVVTGLADIPAGLVGMDRPVSKLADRLGAATGFTPGKWAKEQGENYSQATKDSQAAIDAAWKDPNTSAADVAGAYLANPRATALNLVQSVPSMLAGGVAARGLGVISKLSGAARGAVGEGAVMAGQSMDQMDPGADPQRAAAAALATGVGGAAIGYGGGRLAQRMGVADVDTLMAGRNAADVAQAAPGVAARPGFAKSIAVDATQEALLEEAPQSALETGAQNWAEGKDLTEGMARNVVEGAVAGGVMGGAAGGIGRAMPQQALNPAPTTEEPVADAGPTTPQALGYSPLAGTPTIHPDGTVTLNGDQEFQHRTNPQPVRPSEAMGLDPNAGPLSKAAAMAVDSAPPALPYDNSPTGTLIAGADGVRPQGRAEVVNRQQALAEQQQADEAERQRRAELGQSPFTPFTPIDPPAQPVAQKQIPLDTTPTGTLVVGSDGIARPEIRAEQISRDQAAEKVIPNRIQAGKALRDAGPGHEVVRVDGGFVVRPVQDATLSAPTQAKETPTDVPQPAKAPEETSPAPGAQAAPQTEIGGVGDGPSAQIPASATAPAQVDPAAAGIPGGLQDRIAGNGTAVATAGTEQRNGALTEPAAAMDAAANEAASSPANDLPAPTTAQIEAGNYKKGHINLHGLSISIENPKGSTRSGTRPDGSTWSHDMSDHYGYVKRTVGADNEQIDVYVGPKHDSQKVFVVDQMDQQTGGFDEHKAMLGFDNQMQAMRAYRSNFDKGWKVGPVKAMSVDEFKGWLKNGDTKKPANQPPVQAVPAQAAINSEAVVATPQGRNGTPLAEGGKPFQQRAQADDARKLQPQMRIVKVAGGFALVEKSPAQLAAQDKAARRLAQPNTSPAGQPIAAHQFIAGEGGLNLKVRSDLGVQGNPRIGNRTLYAGLGRGLTLEQATEKLVQGGYLREGASHSDALALIKRSLTTPQFTPEGTERMAEADKQARFEAQQAEEEAIADVETADDAAFEYVADLDPNDDNVPFEKTASSQNSLEADMRAMGFTEEEINEATANEPRASQADRQDGGVAVEAASRDSQEGAGQRSPTPGEDGGLTAPTRADILAQQDRADAAEKAAKAQRRADDERARKEQERKDIAARSQAAADTFELGGDAEQNLSGQSDMFSRVGGDAQLSLEAQLAASWRIPKATVESVQAAVRQLVNGIGVLPNSLGRIVVTTSDKIKADWEPLIGKVDVKSESKGDALGFYSPKTKTVFLIADNIPAGQEMGVVAHELMHKHGEAVLGKEGWDKLHGTLGGWAKAERSSMERQVYDEAAARVRESGAHLSNQELFPYAVQVAMEMGVKPNAMAQQGGVARWLAAVRQAMRQAWDKITGKPELFKAQDLVNLAFGIAQMENPAHAAAMGQALTQQRGEGQANTAAAPGDPQYSRATPAMGALTPDQERAWTKVAGIKTPPTLKERAESFKANLGLRIRQGVFDQFAPIKDVSQAAYMQARLSKGSDGTMEAAMLYGKPVLRDGVPDVDIKDGGFAKVLASLKGEHDRFLWWVAAQRAEKLKAEGKENLFSDQDISSLKTLNTGQMADGTGRTMLYAKALQDLNAFNDSVLQMAVDSGLIDKAAQDLFKGQPYVPFYRVMEEGPGGMTGPRFSSGLVGQQAFKKLKGGTNQLNGDLLENMLLNWSHLYSAAAKNRAAVATMDSAEAMAVAYKVPDGTKGAIKVMRNGMAEHWAVEDPYLLEAVSALHYVPSPLIKPLAAMKQVLTWSVTVNPTFKIRNLIRDSLSAIAQADLSYNPLENVAKGWKASAKNSQAYASMLAGGGLIKFGTGESSERVRNDIKKLGGQLLDDKGWRKLTGAMGSLWDAYNELGDRTENVNRAALYERLVAKGHTPLEANFMARDLMDFSMSGRWDAVRFLAQTVPFLNARLQGLYKLGRAAKEDPRRFGTMAAAVSLASLALLAAYGDDDDWKKREDFDRDSYWWFKIGETAFRIPKPFEVGAIGTIAERTAELMLSDEMTGKRFGERLSAMVFQTFAMDPVPQAFKPLLDVYSNKDSFTKRAIEGQGDEKLRPQDRVGERTSEIARLLGQWGLPEPLTLLKGEYRELSPKQVDFLLRGYFSWVGSSVAGVTDLVARPMLDRGERPAMRLKDTFMVGSFVESLPSGSSRYVSQLYDQARDVEQAWTSYQDAMKRGDTEKAADIQEEDGPKLRNRMAMENAKRQLAAINKQARQIEADRIMSADQKREKLEELERRRDVAARRVTAAL